MPLAVYFLCKCQESWSLFKQDRNCLEIWPVSCSAQLHHMGKMRLTASCDVIPLPHARENRGSAMDDIDEALCLADMVGPGSWPGTGRSYHVLIHDAVVFLHAHAKYQVEL